MKTNIFIPQKIKVGFQNRSDTYTKRLAYVIYYDQKGKLRKEASWQSWRDKQIDDMDFENVPTSGFVLNKKVGDYVAYWNHRQAYVRIYDSRDFEFEITIENLLYILENANSIKGKGLEGDFVYGWDRDKLILIPTNSPDYTEIAQFNKIIHEKNHIKSKELVIGATYRAKDNQEWVYMGRFDYHTTKWNRETDQCDEVNKGKHYYFARDIVDYYKKPSLNLLLLKSLGDKFIGTVSEECVDNYATMFDRLECRTEYSPYDESKDEYIVYKLNEFEQKVVKRSYGTTFYSPRLSNERINVEKVYNQEGIYRVQTYKEVRSYYSSSKRYEWSEEYRGTLKEIYDTYKPNYKNKYLKNSNLYERGNEV